ncbi:MAG: acyltransferase family protein [Prevotella sp.]|nr:acyltransferase family protein [Prevotella sp.]
MVETKKCQGNNNGKERLHFIDVAKGILILLVVYGHLYAWTRKFNPEAADLILQSLNLFISFYMPAFFVITGFCSNFKKPFLEFVSSSFKSILLPGITFAVFFAIISFDVTIQRLYRIGKDFLMYGGQFWFLSALFIARLIYWVLYNNFSGNKTIVYSIILFVIGFAMSFLYNYYEFWWFIHALLLTPYLCLGQLLRNHNMIPFRLAAILFTITLVVTVILSSIGFLRVDYADITFVLKVPAIVRSFINMNSSMIVSLILLSVTGSIMTIGLAKWIGKNALLEYMGKNSIVIYCMHGFILRNFSLLLEDRVLSAFWYYVVVLMALILSVVVSCVIAYVLNRRFLKVLIGRF